MFLGRQVQFCVSVLIHHCLVSSRDSDLWEVGIGSVVGLCILLSFYEVVASKSLLSPLDAGTVEFLAGPWSVFGVLFGLLR